MDNLPIIVPKKKLKLNSKSPDKLGQKNNITLVLENNTSPLPIINEPSK